MSLSSGAAMGDESTTIREAGGLNFLPAATAAGKKRQKHVWASMLNLHRVRCTRFGQNQKKSLKYHCKNIGNNGIPGAGLCCRYRHGGNCELDNMGCGRTPCQSRPAKVRKVDFTQSVKRKRIGNDFRESAGESSG
jgi:hypothetical protein